MFTRRFVTNIFFCQQESWAEAYIAAMLEDSPVELPRRIAMVRAEIAARLAVLIGQERSIARTLELDSLDDALSDLSLLVEDEPVRRISMANSQPEPKFTDREILDLETTICPVCKQLKLADQECQSAFCREFRKKQSA
jgi:hypothetical protein